MVWEKFGLYKLMSFGYLAYALMIPLDTKAKLDNHAVCTIFVGYREPHGDTSYCCMNQEPDDLY